MYMSLSQSFKYNIRVQTVKHSVLSVLSADAIDLGRLVGYLNPSHVTHQRLLLQFISAPEDGRNKRPKHVEQYCSYK